MVPVHKIETFRGAWDFFGPLNGTSDSECHFGAKKVEEEMEKDPLDTKSIRQEMEEYIVLEEDPELCAMAVTVNVKIVVLNDNSGNLTF